jgi:hypothetical protein
VLLCSCFDGIRSYRWFVDVCESIDLIGKTILPITFGTNISWNNRFHLDLSFKKNINCEANTTVFDSFVKEQTTGKNWSRYFPYVLGMLVAISLFRNSGLFEIISNGLGFVFFFEYGHK